MKAITYTDDDHKEVIKEGLTVNALEYEVRDMEMAVNGDDKMHLDYTIDVMNMMISIRED